MTIPESAPKDDNLLAEFKNPERLSRLLGFRGEVDGDYLHWDQLRRRSPPKDFTHREWWMGLRLARRVQTTSLPLKDMLGLPLSFSRTNSLLRALHQVDREVGGRVEVPQPLVTTPQTRDRYLLMSLVEEAISSSQLEGASTTRKVAKEMLLTGRKPRTRSERMIGNNFAAMQLIRDQRTAPLSPAFLLELHTTVTRDTLDKPDEAGRLRRPDEQVTIVDNADGETVHIPPPAKELPARIAALCSFANDTRSEPFVHPVARAILLHFMLAYDHPFVDGNGRTARALFYWSMLRQGYWLSEFLSISRVIKAAPAQYARAFLYTETDAADATYFLLHQLKVVHKATAELHAYLERTGRELQTMNSLLRDDARFNHRQRALLADALKRPVEQITIALHQRTHSVVYQTARNDLLELEAFGLLNRLTVGRRFHFRPAPNLTARLKSVKR